MIYVLRVYAVLMRQRVISLRRSCFCVERERVNVAVMTAVRAKAFSQPGLAILVSPLVTLREVPSDEGISDELRTLLQLAR